MVNDLWYRWVHRIFTALSVVVFASGAMLIFYYRPTAAQAWNDLYQLRSDASLSQSLRSLHRWATSLWLFTLIPLLIVEIIRRSSRSALTLAGTIVLALAASFTGYLLPWDQLALWAVTLGTNMRGYLPLLFGDDVRFVVINGVEVGQSTIRRWFYIHVALGTGVLLLARFARRPTPPAPTARDAAMSDQVSTRP